MERAQFAGRSKARSGGASSSVCDDKSWEELAFAEDAAGEHGGCVWPPRSYACNFCGREFRSAQALGGHMNVHRRDRARSMQSPDPHLGVLRQEARQSLASHDLFRPPQIRRSSPNPIRPVSRSAVSCQSKEGGSIEPEKSPPFLPFRGPLFPPRSSRFDGNTSGKNSETSLNKTGDLRYRSGSKPTGSNSPTRLSLAARTQSPSSVENDEDEAAAITIVGKRRRTDEPSSPFLSKQRPQAVADIEDSSYGYKEGLDLELRLGERPKAKLLRS